MMYSMYTLLEQDKALVNIYRDYVNEHGFTQDAYEEIKKIFQSAFETTCKFLDNAKSISDMKNPLVQKEIERYETILLNLRAEIDIIGREENSPKLEG